MRKRAGGIVPLCDLAAREKTSVSGVVEELLQGWLEGTHKLEDSLSIKFNRITQRKTPPSPVGFFVSYEGRGRFSRGRLCPSPCCNALRKSDPAFRRACKQRVEFELAVLDKPKMAVD
jgi:hypothetical protein